MTTQTTKQIAAAARTIIGRPAGRLQSRHDWEAIDAVKAAARSAGLPAVAAWVPAPGASLRVLVEAYCARVSQAYGLGAAPGPAPAAEAEAVRSLAAVGH
jgi:hypothetical protein